MSCKNCYALTLKYDRLESQYRELKNAIKEMAKKAQGLNWVAELEKQRPARLLSLKKEIERREHYVKTGEWKYD